MAAGVTDRLWEICDIVNILKVLGSPHGELTMRDMMGRRRNDVGHGNRLADRCGCRGAPDWRVGQIRILPLRKSN